MSGYPTLAATSIPWPTIEQMMEADRLAIADFGIELHQMRHVAARFLADLALPPGRWRRMGLAVPPLCGAGRSLEMTG